MSDVTPNDDAAARIRRLEDRLHVMSSAMRAFAEATTDYERLLEVIARTVGEVVEDGCVVRLLEDGGWLRPVAIHLPLDDHLREPAAIARVRAHVSAAHNVAEQASAARLIESGEAVLVPRIDLAQLRSAASRETVEVYETLGIHSLLLVALRARGRSLGVISLFRFLPGSPALEEGDREMAQALADHAALAIQNARLHQSALRDLAEREALEAARVRAGDHARRADRLATLGKLASGLAHEIGTPLSIVSGHAQMIAGGEVTGEKVLESAREIDVQVSRVSRIVRHLLAFARSKGPEGECADVLAVAAGAAELLASAARTGGVVIRVDGQIGRAKIDAESLEQVVTNLLVNAVDASHTGTEVAVTVERVRAAPPGSGAGEGDFICTEIRDAGSGIASDVLPHVFEPFFTTKQPGEGTGLGLAIVHGIVRDHSGWIHVDSILGRGTSVTVYLPVAEAA